MTENIIIVTTLAIIFKSCAFGGLHDGLQLPSNYYNTGGHITGAAIIPAAIQSRHTITFKEVKVPKKQIDTPVVEVQAQETPLFIQFKTYSSPVHTTQTHYAAPKQALQKTVSADEPNYLYHLVNKPVYQEIREIIVPYRRIKQEIRPVVEQVDTIVSQSDANGTNKKSTVSSSETNDKNNNNNDNYNDNYKNPVYNYNGHVGYHLSGPVGIGYASAYKMRGTDIRPYSFDFGGYGGVTGVSHLSSAVKDDAQTYDTSNHYSTGADSNDNHNNEDNYNNAGNSVEGDLQFSGVAVNEGKHVYNNDFQYYGPILSENYGYNYDLNYINDGLIRVYKD